MRIKEFQILRYGPLSFPQPFRLSSFNLFWGLNEQGKTLMVEALIKLLFRKIGKGERNLFEGLNRVEGKPVGFVFLEKDGHLYRLPEQGDLKKITGIQLSDCRNIFVIRDSDLSPSSDEYYADLSSKLVGLRTEYLRELKGKVREVARITSTGDFFDRGEEKLKSRIEKADRLLSKIETLLNQLREKNFDLVELTIAETQQKVDELNFKLEQLRMARNREIWEEGKDALARLKQVLDDLSRLSHLKETQLERWRKLESEKSFIEKELSELIREREEVRLQLQEKSRNLEMLERERPLQERKTLFIEQSIKPALRELEEARSRLFRWEEGHKVLAGLTLPALAGAVLLAALYALSGFPVLLIFSFASIALSGAGIFSRLKSASLRSEIRQKENKIRNLMKQAGIRLKQDLWEALSEAERELEELRDELRKTESQKESLEKRLQDLKEKERRLRSRLSQIKGEVEKLRDKTGSEDAESLNQLLREKRRLEQEKEKSLEALRRLLREEGGEDVLFWEEKLRGYARFVGEAEGISYSQQEEEKLQAQLKAAGQELRQLKEEAEQMRRKLWEIEKEARDTLRPEEPLICSTIKELEKVREQLASFVESHRSVREDALRCIEVLEEIEREEREKVKELFGPSSPASLYFSRITEGLYVSVDFDQEERRLSIKTSDGEVLFPEQLSGGAYDQLYFSIRLALAQKLLQGEKGFFLLDDPFIKADPRRLSRLLEMLLQLAAEGWQIIYFSSKGEVKEALKGKSQVKLFDLSGKGVGKPSAPSLFDFMKDQ